MKALMRNALLIALAANVSFSCTKKTMKSDPSHKLGETTRSRSIPLDCERKDESLYSEREKYLKKLAQHIAAKNPETFSGTLAIENFCFKENKEYEAFNAFANKKGEVRFNTGIFTKLRNDAEMAAILAHELAHVTLYHDDSKHLNPKVVDRMSHTEQELYEKYIQSWLKAVAASHTYWTSHNRTDPGKPTGAKISEFEAAMKAAWKEFQRISRTLQPIKDRVEKEVYGGDPSGDWKARKIILERSAQASEAEADEAGFEFFLRAGFAPEAYVAAFQHLLSAEDKRSSCGSPQDFKKNVLLDEPPNEVDGTHPAACWRIYNIRINEFEKEHKEEYTKLLNKATVYELFPGELKKLKSAETTP